MKKIWSRQAKSAAENVTAAETTATNETTQLSKQHENHIDLARLDHDTREMYREAIKAAKAEEVTSAARESRAREFIVRGPFQLGFIVTMGALVALLVGQMIGQLSTVIMYVVGGMFVALALDPLVSKLERYNIKRPLGITIVFVSFLLVIVGILAIVVPMIAKQIGTLINTAPSYFNVIQNQEWYLLLNDKFGEFIDFAGLLALAQDFIGKPEHWASLAGGVWQAGIGIANGLTAGLIVLILSLYFLSSLNTTKRAMYSMVAKSNRAKVIDITEQVTVSVGGYVNGMVVLALTNAVLGFIMMSIVGVPFAGLVAVGVFFLALIPLVGSVMATVLVSIVALFNSPTSAIIAAVYYLIYMQIESYVFTPKIMNRVVSVPGSLVVIGALAGGALLGLLGALISIPVTATVLMILKQVWMPRQETK